MALSGTYYKNVGSHWRLQLEWSAKQDEANNRSTVTAKLYWISRSSYGVINSGATKDGHITISGTQYKFSGAGLASLKGNQKRLLKTATKTINHDSDGSQDVAFNANFNAEVTLGGTYYGGIQVGTKSYPLNTIPRESSISSSASWTAGKDLRVTISRASSKFNHNVRVYVDGKHIGTRTGVGTSTTFSFSDAENKLIFTELAQSASKSTRVEIDTMSGSTKIGTASKTGTVKAPVASDVGSLDGLANNPNGDGYHQYMYVDQTLNIGIKREDSSFTHKVEVILEDFKRTWEDVGDSVKWTPTETEKSSIYAQMPNDNSLRGSIRITTYYKGVQVRTPTSSYLTFYVRNSNPTFLGGMTYQDIATIPTGIKKTKSQIIQNYSEVEVTIPASAKATARNGATMKSYLITLNGVQQTASYTTSNIVKSMGKVTAGADITLSVKAVDSRGNSTEQTMKVTVIPYNKPKLSRSAKRRNNFEADTILKLSGTFSAQSIGNSLQYVRYRTRKKGASSFGGWLNFTYTTSGATFKATDATVNLDNTESHDVEFYVQDRLMSTSEIVSVSSGEPILFIDSKKKAVGVNKFPTTNNGLDVKGGITADGKVNLKGGMDVSGGVLLDGGYFEIGSFNHDRYGRGKAQAFYDAIGNRVVIKGRNTEDVVVDGLTLEADRISLGTSIYGSQGGGIDLNNSDIIGINQMFMNDTATGDSEGMNWAKSSTPSGSTENSDYDTFRIYNGTGYLNSKPIFIENQSNEVLWEGASYMNGATTVTPKRTLSDCPNGYVLVWSDYNSGSGGGNFNFVYSIIPKGILKFGEGHNHTFLVPNSEGSSSNYAVKVIYVHDKTLVGHDINQEDAVMKDVCLRMVLAY